MSVHEWWFLAAVLAGFVSMFVSMFLMLVDHPIANKVAHALIGGSIACVAAALWIVLP